MPKKHGLGFGNGKILEYEDGTAAYVPTGSFTQAFRVRVADVTGFSVAKGGKMLEREFNLLGNGTLLATASVNHGTSEVLEAWFRAHPTFGASNGVAAPMPGGGMAHGPASTSVADELQKLAGLRDSGILTNAEFAEQKARLLAG